MRSVVVVAMDPGAEFHSGVFDGLEAVAPGEFFFECFDESFAEPVLLRGIWGDVFLFEAVVIDDGTVLARTEDEAVVVAKQHVFWRAAQGSEARQQRFFQSPFCRFGAAGEFQGMTEHFTRAAVDDRHEHAPAISAAVDHGKIGRPALVWHGGNRA